MQPSNSLQLSFNLYMILLFTHIVCQCLIAMILCRYQQFNSSLNQEQLYFLIQLLNHSIKPIITPMPKHKKSLNDQQSDNDDSDDSQKELVVNTDNSPKMIPIAKLPDKPKHKKIVINISDTQYPILAQIAQQLNWIIQDQQGSGDWDIWWTDRQIQPNTLYRMNLHQKINHFPGIYVLARKNLLGLHLMAMQKKFPTQYNFFPQTWMLPMQFHNFRQYYESVEQGKVRTYIVKPEALSQGKGIFLTRNIEDVLNGHKYVVQRYLKNPLLLDGLKFDLRIYVLLAGSDPLRLYIYEQGLARLATRPYQPPTAENLHENFIHLTNYSLNKSNPDYIYNKSEKQMDVGHKRSLKGVYQRLGKNGINVDKLKEQIQECIVKTVISGLPSIRHQYSYCQPEEYEGNMCFHILGFDVMIMDDLKPIIIEVNHTPSFETGTPLDYMIKKNLIKDTLKLMRISSKNKKTLFQKAKDLTKKRIQTGKRDIFKGQQRKQQLLKVQQIRDQEQKEILLNTQKPSGYKVIFPFKDDKKNQLYAKFQDGAQKVMKQLKDMRKKIISDEDSANSKKQLPSSKNTRQSKTSNKQPSIQRSVNKKTSLNLTASQKPQQKYTHQQSSNMQSSGGNSSENGKKNFDLDTILQNREENQTQHNEIKSTPTSTVVCNRTQKKITLASNSKNNNFHIRNNSSCKYSKKITTNDKLLFEEMQYNFESNKYQELMAKFVKSKDLDDPDHNNASIECQMLLEEKLNPNGRKSWNYNEDQLSNRQINNCINEMKQKERNGKNNEIIISSIKGYKQKPVLMSNPTRGGVHEKFADSHLANSQNNRTSKGQRAYGNQTPNSVNNTNVVVAKPIPLENFFINFPNDKQQEQDLLHHSKQRDTKTTKTDNSRLGKFLKPKTYNLHESKFPQQDKYIVRVDATSNNSLGPHHYHKPYTQSTAIGSSSPPSSLMTFQQYNDFCANMINGDVVTQVQNQGYNAKGKLNMNQRNLTQFVNTSSGKSAAGNKTKSSSLVYKVAPAGSKDAHVMFKMIEKSKLKGYE